MTFIARERLMPNVGNIIALVGLDVLAYGLIKLSVWAAVVGNIVTIGKKIFFGRDDAYLHRTQKRRPGLGRAVVLA